MKDTQISFRISTGLKEQATKVAEQQGRTIGNLITYLLMKEVEKVAIK
jgi:antitoxin component of RelBE/YafQ-DinJ toxin-antitoxin module